MDPNAARRLVQRKLEAALERPPEEHPCTYLWVADDELGFTSAKLVQKQGDRVSVVKGFGEDETRLTLPLHETHVIEASHLADMDDIALMGDVHIAPLLYLLSSRYCKGKIYTHTSDVLLAVNPFKLIHGLYDLPSQRELLERAEVGAGDYDRCRCVLAAH